MEQRAISIEQKEERRQEIIDITRTEFLRTDFNKVKMADIANAAGIAKGTLFFYFKTKEELFLTMAQQEINAWYDHFDKILRQQIVFKHHLSIKEFVSVVQNSLKKNDVLVPLFAILDDTLENNIDIEIAFKFKSNLKRRIVSSGELLEQVVPFIKKSDGGKLLYYSFMLIVGTYKVTNPSPVVKKVLKKPGMEMFNQKFKDVFSEMLNYLLSGYELDNKQ
jgi:TetR/AcrR family transcriptional regulator